MQLLKQRGFVFFLLGMVPIGIGGAAAAEDRDDFTVVLLLDTQHYSESHPGIYLSQTGWIHRRAAEDNIRFVPRENKINVEAYSPLLDEHNQDPGQTYSLEYPMSPVEAKEAA
ncbi:MAG: hypothetical protein ABIK89_11190 [Planctomycetota bacterium]